MRWQYARQWNELLNEPIDPLTEELARTRHDKGEPYTAYALDDSGVISVVTEVRLGNGHVSVWDFDEYGRQVWRRILEQHGDEMFMKDAYSYDYGDSNDHLFTSQAERFLHRHVDPDGTGYERRSAEEDPTEEERVAISLKAGATLDEYWVTVPEFGQYDDVCWVGIYRQEAEDVTREQDTEGPEHNG